jgi:ribose transport system substrate-binding protein
MPSPLGSRSVLIVGLALFAGCTTSSSSAPEAAATKEAGSKGTIGVSVLTLTNPFFKVIGDNITAELKKAGYETIVVSGEFDVATQRS